MCAKEPVRRRTRRLPVSRDSTPPFGPALARHTVEPSGFTARTWWPFCVGDACRSPEAESGLRAPHQFDVGEAGSVGGDSPDLLRARQANHQVVCPPSSTLIISGSKSASYAARGQVRGGRTGGWVRPKMAFLTTAATMTGVLTCSWRPPSDLAARILERCLQCCTWMVTRRPGA